MIRALASCAFLVALLGAATPAFPICALGCGAVYRLEPTADGFRETVLYRFQAGADGRTPRGGITLGHNGDLFGTTTFGGNGACDIPPDAPPPILAGQARQVMPPGPAGCGTVFVLQPTADGYAERIAYRFPGGDDVGYPEGALVEDAGGTLYGAGTTAITTSIGKRDCGSHCGMIFALTPDDGKEASERIVYRFRAWTNDDAAQATPVAYVAIDKGE